MNRLSKNSAAVKLLRSKFQRGLIHDLHTPSQVWKSEPVFQKHKLPAFRNCFYKLKNENIEATSKQVLANDAEADEDDLNRKCTRFAVSGNKKRRLIDEECEDSEEDSDSNSMDGAELVETDHGFRPLYLKSIWIEPRTMTRRVSLAIVLPSGVECGGFFARVVEGGEYVELLVRWPGPLVNPEYLHKKWIFSSDDEHKIEPYHTQIIGFQNALKDLRRSAADNVESKVRIPLPFSVQTHIEEKFNLAWKDSTVRIVYLGLKAVTESYAVVKDSDAFEEV